MGSSVRGKRSEQPDPPEKVPLTTGFRSLDAVNDAAIAYQVTVYTGDVPDAGTDADVWLWVDGTAGRSGWLFLDNDEDNFEQHKTDYFHFLMRDLGILTSAWVYFKPIGEKAGWFLSTVSVNGKPFSYYNWIENEGIVRLNPT
jgi:hypothetical protein